MTPLPGILSQMKPMPNHFLIHNVQADGRTLKKVMTRIADALDGESKEISLMACLAMAVVLEAEPEGIDDEEFANLVFELSSYLIVLLTGETAFDDDLPMN